MIDFNKKIKNSNKFRQAAIHFMEHGKYTLAPPGTTDYITYWDVETERCLNGYVAPDGDAITGYHYFYLNYFPILRLVEHKYTNKYGEEKVKFVRELQFADFYDYDYYFFNCVEQAEEDGKHMAVLKARARGYSYKCASMLVRNYELIPKSQNFAVASEDTYLINDGLLTKAYDGMDFIDANTAWAKKRLTDTKKKRVSGYRVKDEFGNEVEAGYRSSIIGISTKNNPDRVRGIRGRLILWEEAGKFKDILSAWQIARPSVEDSGGNAFGTMICFGTGGSLGSDFKGLKEMFYHPDGYNIQSYTNIWDEHALDQKCAFFCPAWSNVTSIDKDTRQRLCMDEDGNSDRAKAIEFCIEQRKKVRDGSSEQLAVDRYIAENPLTPQESILEVGGNIFPKKLLMQQLNKIRTNKKIQNMKHIVDLTWDGTGKVVATEKQHGDITEYPLPKDKKPDGSVVIWEYPIKDPPYGLYIAGCLTPGQKVLTQRGLVNVENVSLDDMLVNKDGKYVKIKNLQRYQKENEPIYTLKPCGSYRTTTFTEEHPIYLKDKGFVRMKDVKEGDWLEIPTAKFHKNVLQNFKEKDEFILKRKELLKQYGSTVKKSFQLEWLEFLQDVLYFFHIPNTITRSKTGQYSLRINHYKGKYKNKYIQFYKDRVYIKIDKIVKQSYTGVVYNFECDTHTYMCRNILTHNCDPFDHDESFTNSLGSTFIFKRVKAGEAWNDVIVAEYSGRPSTAEQYYENVRKLLMFYNAKLLFENERKGIYPYFTNKHCDYLLADQPDKVISEVIKDSKVQRRKGCHMTKSIRQYGEGLIKEWLEEEYEPGHPNIERIYSEPLLEELIMNNGTRNVDRVIALCMVMIYREELYQVKVSSVKENNKKIDFFEIPLFSEQWFNSDNGVEDDKPLFTF